ncbi:MAG TPA: M55 family metallopeptidase, partial [Spirochaetia bacterium]|nr:M55 family metallopeptidase [Spirochaetia bacterium]
MKKYMVRCDMGGVSGVVNLMQIIPGQHGYGYGCRMMTADLLALLKGLKSGGADEIVVYDLHCDGLNLDIEKLPEFAKIVCGKPPYTADWAGGLE